MDVFCGQFGFSEDSVYRLDAETGETHFHASNLETWADKILSDFDFETGWSVAHEWQLRHGALPTSTRLIPQKPFVLGGDFDSANMTAVEMGSAMCKLGSLSTSIRHVPDGSKVTIKEWV